MKMELNIGTTNNLNDNCNLHWTDSHTIWYNPQKQLGEIEKVSVHLQGKHYVKKHTELSNI